MSNSQQSNGSTALATLATMADSLMASEAAHATTMQELQQIRETAAPLPYETTLRELEETHRRIVAEMEAAHSLTRRQIEATSLAIFSAVNPLSISAQFLLLLSKGGRPQQLKS